MSDLDDDATVPEDGARIGARPGRSGADTAYVDGLRMLGRRELSERQIRQRLARRGYPPADVDAAIERLAGERAVDDRRVADAMARTATAVNARGRLRILREIERAGIAPVTARAAVDAAFADLDPEALLERSLDRRLRGGRLIADDREFQRLYRYLVGQGFESDRALRLLASRRRRA